MSNPYDTTPYQLARAHARERLMIRVCLGGLTVLCFLAAFLGGSPS